MDDNPANSASTEPISNSPAAYESVSGPATATVRLLSLDPFDATAILAHLADIDRARWSGGEQARRAGGVLSGGDVEPIGRHGWN
ncbi:hypothetical protein ACTMTI_46860 [Nonomuraea sp. H19]|uniref:hypothetical protein n=1 Tax=Nonomuraea sp. H19 TaxID=3452206 RepID=UPI003F89F3D3